MPKRCKKGTRKCKYSNSCVKKNSVKRTKRCPSGQRQCANRSCYVYKSSMKTRSRRSRS